MQRSLSIAATGVGAQQLYVDVISQNLANINTTAYKSQRPEFQDLLYQDLRRVGANSTDSGTIVPTGIQLGLGVKTGSIYRNNNAGTMQNTQNPLDLAVQGNGFFQVQLPDGTIAYTRSGTFQLSQTGELVNADGFPIQPNITIPQNAIGVSIDKSGEVFVTASGQTNPQNVGQLQLANFLNVNGLQAMGDNLYQETAASGPPNTGNPNLNGFGSILQGFLEASNVDPVSEITNLISAQRAYEFNTRVISKSDEMMQNLNQTT